jgi:hypothetical protein
MFFLTNLLDIHGDKLLPSFVYKLDGIVRFLPAMENDALLEIELSSCDQNLFIFVNINFDRQLNHRIMHWRVIVVLGDVAVERKDDLLGDWGVDVELVY